MSFTLSFECGESVAQNVCLMLAALLACGLAYCGARVMHWLDRTEPENKETPE